MVTRFLDAYVYISFVADAFGEILFDEDESLILMEDASTYR